MKLALLCTILAASASPAFAQASLKERADALLDQAYAADGPAVTVIITDHGRTVYESARGFADVEHRVPATPETVFRLRSNSKQFAAAVILQLAAEGKLSLSDPISKFLPGYPKPGRDATVAQLLNHSSGIKSYTDVPGWMIEANTARAYTTEQMIALFRDLPVDSKPGEHWAYNNSGYVLVGAIIEAVTGKPWYRAIEARISRPLGLSIRYGADEAQVPNMAKGYTLTDKGVAPAIRIHMSVPAAAGGLIGTVGDMAKWADALHHKRAVPANYYAQMTAPTKTADGETRRYGYALEFDSVRGHRTIGHNGGIFGFSTESLYIPDRDVFVAVFTDTDQPTRITPVAARQLAAIAIDDPYPAFTRQPLDAQAVAPLLGSYRFKSDLALFVRDGKLFTQWAGGPEREAFPAGGSRFFYGADWLDWFEITRDAGSKPVMHMHFGGEQPEEAEWLPQTAAPPEQANAR